MALTNATIQMRRGNYANLDPMKLKPGEWAVSLDQKYVHMCFGSGIVRRMATYEAFEEDMEQIQTILATCQDIQTAVEAFEALASQKASEASTSAKEAQSYTKGGTGTRTGEDTDNAKYYAHQAMEATQVISTLQSGTSPLAGSADGNVCGMHLVGKSYKSKNLLKPTLQTTTLNGVTFTNNGDGTYTLNGTATRSAVLLVGSFNSSSGKGYRLTGWNGLITGIQDRLGLYIDGLYAFDLGQGRTFNASGASCNVYIVVGSDITLNNLLIKPMIVDADLYPNTTYDDFEPYGIIKPSGDIKTRNKNLVNAKKIFLNTNYGGITQKVEMDGTLTITGTADYSINNISNCFELKKGTYTISLRWKAVSGYCNVGVYDTVNTKWLVAPSAKSNTFIVENDTVVDIRIQIGKGVIVSLSGMIVQIEEGKTATGCVTHEGSEVHTDRPLLSVGTVKNELIINPDGSGTFVKRIDGMTLDGTEVWVLNAQVTGGTRFDLFAKGSLSGSDNRQPLICDMFKVKYTNGEAEVCYLSAAVGNIEFVTQKADTLDAWKTWLSTNKPTVVYQLATPTTTELSASEVADLLSLQTFQGGTYFDADGAEFTVTYFADTNAGQAMADVNTKLQTFYDELRTAVVALNATATE